MVALEVDQPKNLLVIRYSGVVGPDEVAHVLGEMRAGLAKLESGFRLLADLTDLESMDVACAPFIEKAMDLFQKRIGQLRELLA